jgi:hypothetical protein
VYLQGVTVLFFKDPPNKPGYYANLYRNAITAAEGLWTKNQSMTIEDALKETLKSNKELSFLALEDRLTWICSTRTQSRGCTLSRFEYWFPPTWTVNLFEALRSSFDDSQEAARAKYEKRLADEDRAEQDNRDRKEYERLKFKYEREKIWNDAATKYGWNK